MKYKLTENTISIYGKTLYQIQSLCSFSSIEKGDLGGYLEHEDNLSQEGSCWAGPNAYIMDQATLEHNSLAAGLSPNNPLIIKDNAWLSGASVVLGEGIIQDQVCVAEHTFIKGEIYLSDNVSLYGHTFLKGEARMSSQGVTINCTPPEFIVKADDPFFDFVLKSLDQQTFKRLADEFYNSGKTCQQ